MSQPSQNHLNGSRHTLTDREEDASYWASKIAFRLRSSLSRKDAAKRVFPRVPQTSQERRDASLTEIPLDAAILTQSDIRAAEEKQKTVLYLAYGSNLCNETFRGKRGIKPLSQVNVVVPSLRLTFDLPGIPYTEPCFANSAARDPESSSRHVEEADYHKDRWHKGMVGCVYEVTPTDYAHIIATEGGGASYEDILVDCYPLPDADVVPSIPATPGFKAHTLFAPAAPSTATCATHITSHFSRPNPSYAQPSARYLKLITDGATELSLPREYQAYLHDIRTYTITTKRQAVGKAIFTGIWMPIVMLLFSLGKMLQDEQGRIPKWLGMVLAWVFVGMWKFYDGGFKKVYGDGERTEGDDAGDAMVERYKD
ncbi:hypothetical protein K458DRAFT_45828, partial [Lentithecium fluviatile CBS 122367]